MKISNIFLTIIAITLEETTVLTIMSCSNPDISEKVKYFSFYDFSTHRLLAEIPQNSRKMIDDYVKASYKNDRLQKIEHIQDKALIMTFKFQYDRQGFLLSSLLLSANKDITVLVYKFDNKGRIAEIDVAEKDNIENIFSAHFLEYDSENRLCRRVYAHEGVKVNAFYYDKEGFIERVEKYIEDRKIQELPLERRKYTYYDDY